MAEPTDSDDLAEELRARALRVVEEVTAQEQVWTSPADTAELLHELRVHQIELEMQNEELRRTQAELAVSHTRYVDLYELAPVGYLSLDGAGLIVSANLAFASLLGVSRSLLVRTPLSRLVTAEDGDRFHVFRKRRMADIDPGAFACELRLKVEGAAPLWVQLEATRAHDADGAPVMRVVVSDISQRRRAEAELERETALLREVSALRLSQATFLQQAERLAHVGSWWFDVASGKVTWSEELCRIFGTSCDIPEDRFMDVIARSVHPDDREDARPVGIANGVPQEGDYRILMPDGSVRWVHSQSARQLGDDGSVVAVVGFVQDTTDSRAAQDALLLAKQNLERSNEDLEQFAYVASHDLQEPLRMVSSYVELLRQRYQGQLDADADDFIGFAVEGTERMRQLLEDLLEYSRVDSRGKSSEPVDSSAALSTALANLSARIRSSNAEVIAGELPTVMADESQLMQVFQNLVSNAVKFRRPGKDPRIEISAIRAEAMWEFRVKDNGIGIDPNDFEQVFEILRRMHSRQAYEGTGIGLSLCRRILQRLGGSIWVESSDDEGTTVCFTLPAA